MIMVQHGVMNQKHLNQWIRKENNYLSRVYKFHLLIQDLYTSLGRQELVTNLKIVVEHIKDSLMLMTYMILNSIRWILHGLWLSEINLAEKMISIAKTIIKNLFIYQRMQETHGKVHLIMLEMLHGINYYNINSYQIKELLYAI